MSQPIDAQNDNGRNVTARRRGRPKRAPADAEARQRLLRTGLKFLTEKGYSAVGLDEILRDASVPKGGFYHYFQSKADFGSALIDVYHAYFADKLDRWLLEESQSPLSRLQAFVADARNGMERHDFRRGCLVGNLGQEMGALPPEYRAKLIHALEDWQSRTARCLAAAQAAGEIAAHHDPAKLAAIFWIGWEGAVLRAKLEQGPDPLILFADGFFAMLN
ncbi:TetR/AcrR family transcriptional regulator [Rhizobium sp. 'Codium 1']|uniref:acrylate utilization transcriptional regulator AcuR n=1 Tax=Rhizobium sp. 'Codium 1' TaxID=2940484 RepID=UPI001E532D61|nr:TetR/AcrR family transcriptional regulator [Rhizobium sp. 'Codium 1']MCC8931147.1 TetR/AcrR family transcriptional regulator [Rhizobium sp. 'Codium 1']